MSETAFVPSQMRAAEPGDPVEDAGGNGQRTLLLLGGAAVLAVAAVAAWLLFFSGGDEVAPQTAAAPAPAAQPAAPTTAPSPAVAKPSSPRTRHGFRDPFKPLIVQAEAVVPTVAGAAPAGATTTTGTAATTTGTATGTSSSAAGGATSGTTTPTGSTAHTLKVVSVASNNTAITVKVDGKTYKNLKAGEVFAKFFKVIGIGGQVNVIQFGDEKFNISGTKAVTLAS
jgi:cytoskeletal protein RodZ